MNIKVAGVFLVSSLLVVMTGALAHHGGAAYNGAATVEVVGNVTRFEFVNPHVLIYANVTDDEGNSVEWSGELTSPNRLARSERSTVRWHKDIFQPGGRHHVDRQPGQKRCALIAFAGSAERRRRQDDW